MKTLNEMWDHITTKVRKEWGGVYPSIRNMKHYFIAFPNNEKPDENSKTQS